MKTKKIIAWTKKEKEDLKIGIEPKNRTKISILNMKKRLGLINPKSLPRRKWSKQNIELLTKFASEGKGSDYISKNNLLPYNKNSIQKQMGRLGLSRKIKITKLSQDSLNKLKLFLAENWDKYIPEELTKKWNEINKSKVDKKKIVYHLTKLGLKIPYNEVFKIKYHKKNIFQKENKMDLKIRIEKIKALLPVKYFYEKSFDSNERVRINSELNIILKEDSNIFKCGPLLKKDQEYFLFRKYNYLKHRLNKLTNLNVNRLKIKSVCEIEKIISKIEETRNIILKCNTRLIVRPACKHFSQDTFDGDEFISNGYFHLIRAIDGFDHRKGFKFSTYCTWVLKHNLSKDRSKMFNNKVGFFNDNEISFDPIDNREETFGDLNNEYNKTFISKILNDFEKNYPKNGAKIRIEVIKKLYGLDGDDPLLLKEIGKSLGVSKERVRQIKNETIRILQESNYVYDPIV